MLKVLCFKTSFRMVKVVFAVMIFISLLIGSDKTSNPTTKGCKTTPQPKPSSTTPQPKPSSTTHESNGPDCVNSAGQVIGPENCTVPSQVSLNFTREFMKAVNDILNTSDLNTVMRAVRNLEMALERSDFSESESLKEGNLTAYLHKADKSSGNLSIYASDNQANTNASRVSNIIVQVTLPEELAIIENTTVVFCMIISPKQYVNVTDGRIIGVSVGGKNVSGLRTPVIMSVHVGPLATRKPKCVFYNFTSSNFEGSGCSTKWSTGEDTVICSCDHLTYFAVLMVSPDNVSEKDKVVLSYISQVGCSLSLLFLVVAVILYFVKWRGSADQSQQVHISLAVALILLNGHFIMNDLVVNVRTACIYVAVLLHYSLLATFTWTAIEGFHLYLLLLRVFNIYIRRYLLKLSLVGWGVPAVVVILIFIIDKYVYLNVGISSGKSSNIQGCYISNEVVKNVTILGFFCVIFAFNLGMLVAVVRTLFFKRPLYPGQQQKRRAKDICTILGITCLLGITWGLIFFSFGQLSTVGLYFFCIFNSLQGLFIFIWLCMSKSASSESQENVDTHTSNT
ncbi:adhesion G-protein coupled receptor G2-like [Colossoma macropomum]|uniref:adhesion G-protein coupled receptor G2-like n=1 Tax=Colossoma macropomum TaxID=42526 RepID=UPI001864A813|nr:adhesion G-protein coupled receptor G2-like [Colossoma macropomum]